MPTLNVLKNPFSLKELDQYTLDRGSRVIDWLTANYPNGCGGALRFYVNGIQKPLDDLDYEVQDDDRVVLTINPAGLEPFTQALLISLAVSVIMTAASIGLTLLLKKPEAPTFSKAEFAQPSPVYSVRTNQNQARLGEPVPVVYGRVLQTPDICSQPYKFYANYFDEYLDMLLCIGVGHYEVHEVQLGDSPADTINIDTGGASSVEEPLIRYKIYSPGTGGGHESELGNIKPHLADAAGAAWGGAPFFEDMVSCVEVGDQEFLQDGQTAGWFRFGKSGQQGYRFYVDLFFPQGLYQMMDAGDMTGTFCNGNFIVAETDANGVGTGYEISFPWSITDYVNRRPLRKTLYFEALDAGVPRIRYWSCLLHRTTELEPSGGEINLLRWTGARMVVEHDAGTPAYGHSTIMAVRIKSNQLSDFSERSIKVDCTRKLNIIPTAPDTVVGFATTQNPADVFYDILMNPYYGGQRPVIEIDSVYLNKLRTYWAPAAPNNHYFFNAVYTGKTTIWEALAQCLVPFGAAPLPLGGYMSVMQDGKKSVRTMLFTEQNIVKDSFKLTYSFDEQGAPDGIEVEYRDPVTFSPAYVTHPSGAIDPERVVLFGCTNLVHASEFALLQWQRRTGNRRAVTFETEMEGMIPRLGDHVAVQHTLPRWGQSGFVVGVTDDRLHITLDRKLKWTEVTGPYVMMFRDNQGGLSKKVTVTRDGADDRALLAEDPWADLDTDWSLTLQEELTHFAWGNETVAVKDFILTKIAPKGTGQVTMEGVYYDETVFPGTMHFMQTEVPS